MRFAHFAYLRYILSSGPVPTRDGGTITGLGVQADLLMLGNPVTDEFKHQFLGLTVPSDMDGNPNPYFDDVTDDDIPDGRVAVRDGYIRSAYHEADGTLGLGDVDRWDACVRSDLGGGERVSLVARHVLQRVLGGRARRRDAESGWNGQLHRHGSS